MSEQEFHQTEPFDLDAIRQRVARRECWRADILSLIAEVERLSEIIRDRDKAQLHAKYPGHPDA